MPEPAFISVLKFMCLIWTCKRISVSCASVVGVWRSYVGSETGTVSFCLCRIPGVVFMFKHKKHLLQHSLDKSILLTCWSSLSADCNSLGYRSPELLYRPELVELSPHFSSEHSSYGRMLAHHMNFHVSLQWLHPPKCCILQDGFLCGVLIYAKQRPTNRPSGLAVPAPWHYASVWATFPLWLSAENTAFPVLWHCLPRSLESVALCYFMDDAIAPLHCFSSFKLFRLCPLL